ncbi:MarR family transcriptional regulator [Streptomyces sp. NPDC007264]|uniref:MarR family transcriptional regulator n=1 Tax=Streptomyces sp. NPDC007264 TaxID=3364777 RepID=UPI0036DF1C0A
MTGIGDSPARDGYDLLSRAVTCYAREKGDGGLRVSGRPGGVVHVRDGLVVAVASPGAPGPGTLLLRSGRSGAGAAALRVVRVMAMQDAVFAIVAGRVDGCMAIEDPAEPADALAVGEMPTRLLHQAARRLAALDVLPHPVRPDRERPLPAPEADLARLGAVQREVMLHADGRRTARDIAFATGSALYTVTVEMARLLGAGYLECVPSAESAVRIPGRVPPEGLRPRTPPQTEPQGVAAPGPVSAVPPSPPPASVLPRRTPGASGITETPAAEGSGRRRRGFFRLRSGAAT